MSQQNPATLLLERRGGRSNDPPAPPGGAQRHVADHAGELLDALAAAETGGVRIAVLRGSGGHFSAGADLHDMARAREAPIAHETDPMASANAAFGHAARPIRKARSPSWPCSKAR